MTRREVNGIVVLTPKGHLYEGEECDRLERGLEELLDLGVSCVIVNLSEAGHLSARAVGVIAHAHSRLVERSGHLVVRDLRPDQRYAFEITKLTDVLELHGAKAAAGHVHGPALAEAFEENSTPRRGMRAS